LHSPLLFFDDVSKVVLDPSNSEEQVMEGKIIIAVNIYNDICFLYKPGGAPLAKETLENLLQVCFIKVKQVTLNLREAIKNKVDHSSEKLKEKFCVQLEESTFEKS